MQKSDLSSIAFPSLSEQEIASLASCSLTVHRKFKAGEKLFAEGDQRYSFFVVKSGEVEILDPSRDEKNLVVVHMPGEFTGEIAQLSGSRSMVDAVARVDSEAYELSPDAFRELLNHQPELGDMVLQAFIARRQLLREPGNFTGMRVIGSRYSQDTFRIRDFLAKNLYPFVSLDLEDNPDVKSLLEHLGLGVEDTPVVALGRSLLLRNPSNRELADTLGLRHRAEQMVYDLVVVGAGPAGLAAAVYGASEGLETLVLDQAAPGGQAGRSMRIENYLGFPAGITGEDLAERATVQANKFGARMSVSSPAMGLTFENLYSVLHLEGDERVTARCLLIATGADYRLLQVENCKKYEGCGVYYAATPLEARMCAGANVVVVGGGNSAGQAAVYLAGHVRQVHLLIRGNDLYKSMSNYLVRRIELTGNIELICNTEIHRMLGDGHLETVEIVNKKTTESRSLETPAVFSFIGAIPRTDWLPAEIEKDPKGFVRTGPALAQSPHWKLPRNPFLLETSRRGVFAAGDVRSGSTKRVGSAVGEGAMAVQFVHEYMKEV